jgi:3-hydroxyisobutyrate dehydrogenase and related beta-hydroxyacid dehydrogenases
MFTYITGQRKNLGHFKDLKLINAQITRTGAVLPMTEVAIEKYARAVENGEGQKDFSVIGWKPSVKTD